MSKRKTRTPEELRKASDALFYEIDMLNKVTDSLHRRKRCKGFIWDALVESFVVHTRNLIEFFYPTGKTKADSDTMIASDFFSDTKQWEEDIPKWLVDVRTRAHKLLAHLSYSRSQKYEHDKGWQYLKIRKHLNDLFEKWFISISSDKFGDKLRNYKVLSKSGIPISCETVSSGDSVKFGQLVSSSRFAKGTIG